MKQIEEYVNNVYRDVKGNEKEIQELKLEMNNHLLESVQGLKSEGKSEREAINVAIDRFGKENELRSILGQLFQIQKTFGKRLLYIGLGIFLLSIIIFVYTLIPANGLNNEQTSIADEILAIVPKEGQLSKSTREEIESLIRNAKFTIEKVVVKSYSTGNEIVYEYGMYGNSNSGKLYSVYFNE